jgi:hypothetical protein
MGKYYSGKDMAGKQAKVPVKEATRLHGRLHQANLRNRPI